ncbi:hypothetical protein MN086_04945 [Sulfurovum sp. XGS-02]|uniref:hypothetical protein n=1 Tax=Sulfurovum sp. XGS-02 TaxID=2925411 RepID=UPI00204749A2|nr:hypothetical protein [Sulfurovum sp. XGS-02]UPT78496.1 hypothetical protein MN086_04945 [Sulfurovum sp. XGS-02]
MKSHKVYFLAIILVMLNVMFFDGSSSTFIENTSETKIEVSLEEQGSEEKLDEKLLVNTTELSLKEPRFYTLYDFTAPIVDQLYLNNIFKPPKFS